MAHADLVLWAGPPLATARSPRSPRPSSSRAACPSSTTTSTACSRAKASGWPRPPAGSNTRQADATSCRPSATGSAVRLDQQGGRSVIRAILPRRTLFSRKAAGRETEEQVIAANVDTVLIVFGLDTPVNARAIERYLVVARRSGAAPVIVLNKADVAEDVGESVAEATAVAGDAPVHAVSTRGAPGVVARWRRIWPGPDRRAARAVGRREVVDRQRARRARGCCRPARCASGMPAAGTPACIVNSWCARPGGLIIDTPGMRELQLWDADDVIRRHVRRHRGARRRVPLSGLPSRPGARLRGQGRGRGRHTRRRPLRELPQARSGSKRPSRSTATSAPASTPSGKARLGSKALKAMQKQRGR